MRAYPSKELEDLKEQLAISVQQVHQERQVMSVQLRLLPVRKAQRVMLVRLLPLLVRKVTLV